VSAKLERTTFETSRAAEYFDARQLSTLTGVPTDQFANVVLKELVDNSLDACEMAGVSPRITVEADGDSSSGAIHVRVSDNGPGIPSEVVRSLIDYDVRVSDKAAYRSPTRGAQGNALKTVIGIPYALGSRKPLTVVARGGIKHVIEPSIDPAGNLHIGHDERHGGPCGTGGTSVDVPVVPGYVTDPGLEHVVQEFDPTHWVRSFAAFNPHATFRYQAKAGDSGEARIYKSTREDIKKYVPSQPTSAHWYSAESLRVLVFSHIALAERGGKDLPLGTFVRQFAGLSSTAKAKNVCSQLPAGFTHLSDFKKDPDTTTVLLAAMKSESRPPKASALGYVGEDHFRTFFEDVYEVGEFKYVRRSGTLPSGLPFTFEFALAVLDEPGHLYCGINFSPTFGDPLEGTTLAGPEFRARGIQGFLSQGYALPTTDDAWYRTPASVTVAAHIVTPAPLFLDRGKTRLDMEGV
jgi:DNA topoisomerase VI subunit B